MLDHQKPPVNRSTKSNELEDASFPDALTVIYQSLKSAWNDFRSSYPYAALGIKTLGQWGLILGPAYFMMDSCRVVRGSSMEPNIHDGDKIVHSSMTSIDRFDLITFLAPPHTEVSFIKRVIGLPGETIELQNGVLYIDGKETKQPWHIDDCSSFGPVSIPNGALFVLGDNRARSCDSREFGLVNLSESEVREVIFQYTSLFDKSTFNDFTEFDPKRILAAIKLITANSNADLPEQTKGEVQRANILDD